MAKPSHLTLIVLLWTAGLLPVAHGQPAHAPRPPMGAGQQTMGPEAAAAQTRRMLGGRILGVRTVREGNRIIQRVKVLLPGGRVRILSLDARTGKVLE